MASLSGKYLPLPAQHFRLHLAGLFAYKWSLISKQRDLKINFLEAIFQIDLRPK
jgi:hypothetical protein